MFCLINHAFHCFSCVCFFEFFCLIYLFIGTISTFCSLSVVWVAFDFFGLEGV